MSSRLTQIMKRADGEILVPVLRKFLFDETKRVAAKERGKYDIEVDLMRFKVDLMERVIKQYTEIGTRQRDSGRFHPSQLSSCQRKMFFDVVNAPKNTSFNPDNSLREYIIFSIGDSYHFNIQALCHVAGILEGCEITLEDDKLNIEGHADGVLTLDGERMLLEIKSANSRSFTKVVKADSPDGKHIAQARMYMKVLGLKKGIILYCCKDRPELKEFIIEEDDVTLKPVFRDMRNVEAHKRDKTIPARAGTSPNCDMCRWCNYTHLCFSSERLGKFEKEFSREGKVKKKVRIKKAGSSSVRLKRANTSNPKPKGKRIKFTRRSR